MQFCAYYTNRKTMVVGVQRKVALYGAGNVARKKYFLMQQLFEIECCYDNNENKIGGLLYDTPIRKWQKVRNNAVFIIITTDFWKEIALQLEDEGLELGKDYLPYYIYDDLRYSSIYYLRKDFLNGKYLNKEFKWSFLLPDKKIAIIYGNCQTGVYKNTLMLSREFKEKYIVIYTPEVWEYNFEPEFVSFFLNDKYFWETVDLFIYQFVSKENDTYEELASEYCLEKLNKDCKKVAIVSLDFGGYFPQKGERIKRGIFGFRDKYIDALMQQNLGKEKIIELLSDEQFIPDVEIENCVKKALFDLKKKDSFADVKIYDYIVENYTKEQLFYSPLHPCDNLIREYAQRIFQYLGLEWDIADEDFAAICCGGIMRGADLLIYPSVIRKLGLKKYSNRFHFNREYITKGMFLDLKQCMEIYIRVYR